MDKKNLLIIGGVFTGIVLVVSGITMVVLGGDEEPTTGPGHQTNTPTLQQATQEPGMLSIEPMQINMVPGENGQLQGMATISALFQDFRATNISTTDSKYTWKSDCIGRDKTLTAGSRCNIIITYNEQAAVLGSGPMDPSLQPTLIINGQSKTPGGSIVPVESKAIIAGFDPTIIPQGQTPIITSDMSAPTGLDPYGPAPMTQAPGNYVGPPVDYSQAPIPPSQPTLTPQQQFLLARRQAVFGGMRPNTGQQQQSKKQGGWDELNVPTATSSYRQDMSRVVTMDRVITAVLVRTYDSRAGQQVTAQVDRNVYGAHGRNVLIPRGSTLVGNASGGAERVAISWTQIIRPDGARFKIEASSADAMGQAGVPGRVNERLGKRYGAILLGTALSIGAAKAVGAEETAGGGDYAQSARNNGAIIKDILREDLKKVTDEIVQRNQKIERVVTVPAGTRITVIPSMDLQLRPLRGPEVQSTSYPRAQNAGAPAPRFNPMAGNGQNTTYNGGQPAQGGQITPPENITFNTPPQVPTGQPMNLPSTNAPTTGSTPPWSTN